MLQINREYVITLKNRDDLEGFYNDMENEGTYEYVPGRAVECVAKRPISRNTHYLISKEESEKIANDPRVEAVTLVNKLTGAKSVLHSSQTAVFSKANNMSSADYKNWALYRSQLESNVPGWGSESGSGNETATINFTATGENVDVVVLDEIAYADHVEFGSRFEQYDWFANHNLAVWPTNPNSTYAYSNYSGGNNHATHVASIIAGATQGWARGATIFNLRHDTSTTNGDPGSYTPSDLVIDYIREFHASKSVNPDTGRVNPTLVNCSWGLGFPCNETNPNLDLDRYPGGRGSKIPRINYRGTLITPESVGNPIVDTGYSGVCNTTTRIAQLANYQNGGNRITSTSSSVASVSSIALSFTNTSSLTNAGNPTNSSGDGVDIYDDAVWSIALPFNIDFMGAQIGPTGSSGFTNCFVSSNSYVYFAGGTTSTAGYAVFLGAGAPNARKIHISAGDRSCQRLYTGTLGSTPNRTFVIRWEGHDAANGGVLGSPTVLWEMKFYESTPNQIDLHIGDNACYRGEFTSAQLEDYGIIQSGALAPYRDAALDADIVDAINEGIIFVSSAGNGGFKIDDSTGDDYDNYFVDNGEIFYYHRGATPAKSHPDMICVGSHDGFVNETKSQNSNSGPGVTLYAPGANIAGAVFNGTGDSGITLWGSSAVSNGSSLTINNIARNASNVATITTSASHGLSNGDVITIFCNTDSTFNVSMATVTVTGASTFTYPNTGAVVSSTSAVGTAVKGYYYQKYAGTSIAAAQVSGILALALEEYPKMTQAEAKAYLLSRGSKDSKLTDSGGGFTDTTSLQGGSNKVVYYFKERATSGNVFPKINYKPRPSSGNVYPRPKIRRRG